MTNRAFSSSRAAFLFLISALLMGCATLDVSKGFDPAGLPDFTGNWQFTGLALGTDPAPGPVTLLVGALANSGTNLSGTFRLVSNNGCISPTQDVTFSGNQDKYSLVTLYSTNLPSNPITITLVAPPLTNADSAGIGTYTINGSGPCAMPKTNFGSLHFQPVTGVYAGTFTSTTNMTATVATQLTQATADPDGRFPVSGTLTLTTPSCTNTFTVNGLVTGPTFSASLSQITNGSSGTALFIAVNTPDATQLSISSGINIISANCNAGSFSGTLRKQ